MGRTSGADIGYATPRSVMRHSVPVDAAGAATASTSAPRPGATRTRSASTVPAVDRDPVTDAASPFGAATLTTSSGDPDASANTPQVATASSTEESSGGGCSGS